MHNTLLAWLVTTLVFALVQNHSAYHRHEKSSEVQYAQRKMLGIIRHETCCAMRVMKQVAVVCSHLLVLKQQRSAHAK